MCYSGVSLIKAVQDFCFFFFKNLKWEIKTFGTGGGFKVLQTVFMASRPNNGLNPSLPFLKKHFFFLFGSPSFLYGHIQHSRFDSSGLT